MKVPLPLVGAGPGDPIHQAIDILAERYPADATPGEKYAWMDDLQLLLERKSGAASDRVN